MTTDEKLDKLDDRLNSIDVTLAKQSVILDEHVKRSTMLEEMVKPMYSQYIIAKFLAKWLGILLGSGLVGMLITWLIHLK